jgi:hypothetical protein
VLNQALWCDALFGDDSHHWQGYIDGLRRSGLCGRELLKQVRSAEVRTGKECPQLIKDGLKGYQGRRVYVK